MRRTLPLLLTTATLAATLAACGPAARDGGDAGSQAQGAGGTTATGGAGDAGAAATAGTGGGPVVKAGATAAAPGFRGSIATGRDTVRSRVRYSWRRGARWGRWNCGCCRPTTGGSTGGCIGGS